MYEMSRIHASSFKPSSWSYQDEFARMNLFQMSSINHCQRQCIGAYRKARAHITQALLSNQGTVLSKQMAHCDVPLELWRNIFTLACTDGGFTGISLALVSKHFHAASLPVRLHSLALTSLRQVEGFLSFIEAQQDVFASGGGLRVHHLLLKDADSLACPLLPLVI
ncbi:hypothetical protein A0H81_09707 [Grifola frondosa]|uniref:Uncharacterized protein n=1 Tax=Grifola frondosa TaxID=5627 RepID=A0A1C7M0M4_GRIFR|nr:hypothetical protein A0H81_09707 [Grifola frondosa]